MTKYAPNTNQTNAQSSRSTVRIYNLRNCVIEKENQPISKTDQIRPKTVKRKIEHIDSLAPASKRSRNGMFAFEVRTKLF